MIRKFNDVVQTSHPEALIDLTVITIRDAIAHGRIAGKNTPTPPMTLLKFGKEQKDGEVQITTKIIMDPTWFTTNIELVKKQTDKIYLVSHSMGIQIIEKISSNHP